jgi:predicted transposase YdaD
MSVMAQEREQGRIEGRAEGRAEGEATGKAKTLLRLLDRRFHNIPEAYRTRVLAANADQLDTWIDAVLDADSMDAVFGTPTAH